MSGKKVMSFDAEWLFDAIHYAEDSSLSKGYEISFAGGKSGISFGAMQIDLATNSWYRDDFISLMGDSGKFAGHEVSQMSTLIQLPATEAKWALLEDRVNEVLSSREGRDAVDQMNEHYFQDTFAPQVERLFSAARDNPEGLGSLSQDHPDYQASFAYAAAWVNRTGEPTIILNLMTGELTGEAPSLAGIKDYISGSKQFQDKASGGHGENFSNWSVRIENAVKYANSKNPTEMGDYGATFSLWGASVDFRDFIDPLYSQDSWGLENTWSATIFTDSGDQFEILFEGNEAQFDVFLNEIHQQSYLSNKTSSWVSWFSSYVGISVGPSNSNSGSGANQNGGGWSSGNYDWDWDWEADWDWSSASSDWGSGTVTSSSWLDS